MKQRLVELIKQDNCINPMTCSDKCPYVDLDDCHSARLADHLFENGVIALPVNAGDTIYRPFGSYVETWVVTMVVLHPDEIVFIDDSENSFKESDIGVSTFLTREEAEQKLKERKED